MFQGLINYSIFIMSLSLFSMLTVSAIIHVSALMPSQAILSSPSDSQVFRMPNFGVGFDLTASYGYVEIAQLGYKS